MFRKVLFFAAAVILLAVGAVFLEFQSKSKPTLRSNPDNPVYTIGELKSYNQALSDDRNIVKFGPMFLGLYPGGLAFPSVDAARLHLSQNGWDTRKWGVFELSGDFLLDVTGGYTNKSLVVVRAR